MTSNIHCLYVMIQYHKSVCVLLAWRNIEAFIFNIQMCYMPSKLGIDIFFQKNIGFTSLFSEIPSQKMTKRPRSMSKTRFWGKFFFKFWVVMVDMRGMFLKIDVGIFLLGSVYILYIMKYNYFEINRSNTKGIFWPFLYNFHLIFICIEILSLEI